MITALFLAASGCKPKEINQLAQAGSALSTIFAAETAKTAGGKKQIVMIVSNTAQGPWANVASEYRGAFEKQGLSVVETKAVDLGDAMHYADYGLKAADLLDAITKHSEAGAIVSLVGAPLLRANDLGSIPANHPPILVIATAQIGLAPGVPGNLATLMQMLDAKVVQWAIVDGAGTGGGKTDTEKNFNQHYQILRSNP